jgi:hypothetical protein
MLRRSARRLTTAFTVVMSLLFAQLALANYVCPKQVDAVAMAEMVAAGVPCEGMDADQPALCAEHSSAAPQSVETVKLPTLSLPMVVQMFELPLETETARPVPPSALSEAKPPPDPLFLSTLRLRV